MAQKVRNAGGEAIHAEHLLDRIASRSHGIVTRAEALTAGLTPAELRHRLMVGSLIAVHRGVYRVGHQAPSEFSRCMAATKACGSASGLSGYGAAHLLELVSEPPEILEVTAPGERRVEGVRMHRARRVRPEFVIVDGIRVTTPAWTLLDIAPRLDDVELGQACHEAWVKHRCGLLRVEAVLRRRGPVVGSRRLLRLLGGDDPLLLSRLERAFVKLLRDDGRELPVTNVLVDRSLVDCRWPHLKLTIELDSYRFHGSRQAWERDRRREREARARGDDLIRFTSGDVFERPEQTLAEVRLLVPLRAGRRRSSGSPRPS